MQKSKPLQRILFALLGVLAYEAIDLMEGGKVHVAIGKHPVLFLFMPLLGVFLIVLICNLYRQYRPESR